MYSMSVSGCDRVFRNCGVRNCGVSNYGVRNCLFNCLCDKALVLHKNVRNQQFFASAQNTRYLLTGEFFSLRVTYIPNNSISYECIIRLCAVLGIDLTLNVFSME